MVTISSFLEMGGYGAYIWPCYGISAILMIAIYVTSVRTLKENRAILNSLEKDTMQPFNPPNSVNPEQQN